MDGWVEEWVCCGYVMCCVVHMCRAVLCCAAVCGVRCAEAVPVTAAVAAAVAVCCDCNPPAPIQGAKKGLNRTLIFGVQEVLGLEVAVRDVFGVHVLDDPGHVPDDLGRLDDDDSDIVPAETHPVIHVRVTILCVLGLELYM